jgi:hypothetical protein
MSKTTKITITAGENRLSPISYNTFSYGGMSLEVEIEDGEDVAEVYKEKRKELADLVNKDFEFRKGQFLRHVEKANDDVKSRARGRG